MPKPTIESNILRETRNKLLREKVQVLESILFLVQAGLRKNANVLSYEHGRIVTADKIGHILTDKCVLEDEVGFQAYIDFIKELIEE